MATSNNPAVQDLMSQIDNLDGSDGSLEAKLNEIARLVQAEQKKVQQGVNNLMHNDLTDPADAFACEGCQ